MNEGINIEHSNTELRKAAVIIMRLLTCLYYIRIYTLVWICPSVQEDRLITRHPCTDCIMKVIISMYRKAVFVDSYIKVSVS